MALASVLAPPDKAIKSTVWSTRAWTCQENFLSERLLIFTNQQVFWCDNNNIFWDDVHSESEPEDLKWFWGNYTQLFRDEKRLLEILSSSGRRYQLFQCYCNLVEDYTARSLTYQQHALEAFQGIVYCLSKHLSTPFLYGLPIRFLEEALLFETGSFNPLSRRDLFPRLAPGSHF
jgi:hypothetical protein